MYADTVKLELDVRRLAAARRAMHAMRDQSVAAHIALGARARRAAGRRRADSLLAAVEAHVAAATRAADAEIAHRVAFSLARTQGESYEAAFAAVRDLRIEAAERRVEARRARATLREEIATRRWNARRRLTALLDLFDDADWHRFREELEWELARHRLFAGLAEDRGAAEAMLEVDRVGGIR